MRVDEVMTPRSSLITATVPGSREDVLQILQERNFSSVPIIKNTADGEVFRGLVSREGLIDHADEEQLAMLLEDVEPVSSSTTVTELARHIVKTGERRIPVVNDHLEGIVTITDVVRAIANGGMEVDQSVGSVAGRQVHSTYEAAPLLTAKCGISLADELYAVVLDDDGKMSGIVTEVDIIAVAEVVEGVEGTGDSIAEQDSEWAWEGIKAIGNRLLPTRNVELPSAPVSDVMTSDVVTVARSRTVTEAAQRMISADVEQIPLIEGGELAGIVKDIHLLEALYE